VPWYSPFRVEICVLPEVMSLSIKICLGHYRTRFCRWANQTEAKALCKIRQDIHSTGTPTGRDLSSEMHQA
jgi:hypothetical protein